MLCKPGINSKTGTWHSTGFTCLVAAIRKASVAAILTLVGIGAAFPNATSMTFPQLTTTAFHQGGLTRPRTKDGCNKWRYLMHSFRSNEDLWNHAMYTLKDSYATCALFVVCELHQDEEKVCGPALGDASNRCFPRTKAGHSVTVNCPETLMGVAYSGVMTKTCHNNGTWTEKAVANCTPTHPMPFCFYPIVIDTVNADAVEEEQEQCDKYSSQLEQIALIGHTTSLISTTISFLLFWWLNNIRCRRNIIHWNLIASYIFRITLSLFVRHPYVLTEQDREANGALCRILMTVYMYSESSNYFWMFVEGLHLHMMVVSGYSHDRIPMKAYAAIGWGSPMIPTVLWIAVKVFDNSDCWYINNKGKSIEYLYQAPILILLILNLGILVIVVSIIFTKLQSGFHISGGSIHNDREKYIKATKAALFLFPLLGFTYVIFLINPSTKVAALVFYFFHTLAQSFQGFLVCMIYCFGNNEVQKACMDKVRNRRMQSRLSCCWPIHPGVQRCESRSSTNASANLRNRSHSRSAANRESGLSYSGAQPEHTETFNIADDETSVERMNVTEYRLCSRRINEKPTDMIELTTLKESA